MLPLTPGTVPSNSTDLSRRLQAGLARELHVPIETVDVTVRGSNDEEVENISLDLTAASLQAPAPKPPAVSGPAVHVRQLNLDARPLRVHGMPVQVEATAAELSCQWVTGSEGELWLHPARRGGLGHGRLRIWANFADLQPLLARIAAPLLAEHGFTLTSATAHLDPQGPTDRLSFRANLLVERAAMTATIEVTGIIAVNEAHSVCLEELHATSANPFVALGLGLFTGTLRNLQNRRLCLPEAMIGGLDPVRTYLDVVDEQVELRVDLRQPGTW